MNQSWLCPVTEIKKKALFLEKHNAMFLLGIRWQFPRKEMPLPSLKHTLAKAYPLAPDSSHRVKKRA
jgi:hypothetical protein